MKDVGSQGPLRGSRADGVNCEGGEPRRRVSPQGPLRGSVSCGSGWSVPRVSIQLTLAQQRDRCVAVFRAVVAGRYLVCRFN